MEDNIIELNVKLELDDIIKFKYDCAHNDLKKVFKKLKRDILIWILLIVVMAVSTSLFRSEEVHILKNGSRPFPFAAVILFIIIIFITISTFRGIKIKAIKEFEDNKLLKCETKYVFSDGGIEINLENGQINLEWDKIFKVEALKHGYSVNISSNVGYVIPKRFFTNIFEEALFEDLVKIKLPKERLNF